MNVVKSENKRVFQVLKNDLRNIDVLKSNEISKFDCCYEGDDKTKILKVCRL